MPRKNGIQVVQQLRNYIKNLNQTSIVKVNEPNFVFLTAYLTIGFKKQLESLNVQAYYEKPLELEVLRHILYQSRIQMEVQQNDNYEDDEEF